MALLRAAAVPVASWTGPAASVSYTSQGYPRISVGPQRLLPHWIYPTQGGAALNATFRLEVDPGGGGGNPAGRDGPG